jgi:hypothetical protein
MKKFLLALMAIASLCLVPQTALALSDWTVIVYMVNDDKDTTLEKANFQNLKDMKYYGCGENHNLLIQMDGMSSGSSDEQKLDYKGGSRLRITKDKIIDEGAIGEVNMGSPQTLWDCLKWACDKYPAKHYALIINSHGSGVFTWWGEGSTASQEPGKGVFNPDRRPGRFVAYDHTDHDALTVFEIAEVLKAFNQRYLDNGRFDVVGFDACMPGSIEVLYQLRDACEFVVGSPETTPIRGFNYEAMARFMARNSGITPAAFAIDMAERLNSQLIGAWKTSGSQQIAFALNNLSMQLLQAMNETGRSFSVSAISSFGGGTNYWDLLKIANSFARENTELNGASNRAVIKTMGRELLEVIEAARLTRNGSISVTWPGNGDYKKFRPFYKALDLSKDCKWDEVLDLRELGIK